MGNKFWKWVLTLVVQWVMKNLTADKVEEIIEKLKAWAWPVIVAKKAEFIAMMREAAKKTPSELDDSVVEAVVKVLDALIPDVP